VWDWLSNVANILEVLSFIITVILLFEVSKLRQLQFRGLVPRLRNNIADHASKLNDYYASYATSAGAAKVTLEQLVADLRSLEKRLRRGDRRSVIQARAAIQKYLIGGGSRDRLWNIYAQTIRVIREIDNMMEERTWLT
jgi:hypothetical protein